MSRTRDRASNVGLLPRMEARARKKGGFSYRYHPVGAKPIPLGTDRSAAIIAVASLNGCSPDKGTINDLWRLYQISDSWKLDLSQGSRDDYTQSHKFLLKVFGKLAPAAIKPSPLSKYLRVERASAPVRANREFALLSNLMNLAIERGELDVNPCKQVRRNKERPRKQAPSPEVLKAFLNWAWSCTGQAPVLAGMAEFASVTGNRGIEFRQLTWPQVAGHEIRIMRAKQHGGKIVEVVKISPKTGDLLQRLRHRAKDDRHGYVFPNSQGNAYTAQNFKLAFNRLKTSARLAGALGTTPMKGEKAQINFKFHDLSSYFVTAYKSEYGTLPELHADPATTSRVYDSSREVKRNSL